MMEGAPPDVIDIVCRMLDVDQRTRMTVQEALRQLRMATAEGETRPFFLMVRILLSVFLPMRPCRCA